MDKKYEKNMDGWMEKKYEKMEMKKIDGWLDG